MVWRRAGRLNVPVSSARTTAGQHDASGSRGAPTLGALLLSALPCLALPCSKHVDGMSLASAVQGLLAALHWRGVWKTQRWAAGPLGRLTGMAPCPRA
jgi:hypothetical protein